MTITFLGTGTSQGVPVIACDCSVCRSTDPRDKRLRSSIMITAGGHNLVVDTGPDFRYQMLRQGVKRLDAVLFTHSHKDHVAGLDDVRAFNRVKGELDIYASAETIDALKREFYYAFTTYRYPGVPQLQLHEIGLEPFTLFDVLPVVPIEVLHYRMPVLGFRFGDFTYITDAKTISPGQIEKIRGSKTLVINALQREPHISHLTIEEAIHVATEIGAEQTYFTHISHRLGRHEDVEKDLPNGISLAYDGLQVGFSVNS